MNEVIKLAAAIVVLRKLAQTSQQPNPAAPQFAGSQGGRVGIGPQQPLPVAPEVQLDPVLLSKISSSSPQERHLWFQKLLSLMHCKHY
jgi:hypothetical protein